MGRDLKCPPVALGVPHLFQSTRPRGARHVLLRNTPVNMRSFNPRARVGRDLRLQSILHKVNMFQSTRPRGARRIYCKVITRRWRVSIHAPAWGATQMFPILRISSSSFNPRARVGRDHRGITPSAQRYDVSIHAPAWGATHFFWRIWCCVEQVSIHAPAWGATRSLLEELY